jgi:GR25 family glycosyltransferase involved in LPS biosynthesis
VVMSKVYDIHSRMVEKEHTAMHILCINLATAVERWTSIENQVARVWPEGVLHRIDAIHWRSLSDDLSDVVLTPFSRYLIQHPDGQSRHRVSHRQMDTVSSVAIMLSHIQCWTWLRDRPNVPWALVLEDDACFDTNAFPDAMTRWIHPLMIMPQHWDCVILGYFAVEGPMKPMVVENLELSMASQFFGAHAYMISQHGAATLLQHVYPIDQQVDGYLLTLHQIGILRMFMMPVSVVSQCMDMVQRDGSHHTHTVMPIDVTPTPDRLPSPRPSAEPDGPARSPVVAPPPVTCGNVVPCICKCQQLSPIPIGSHSTYPWFLFPLLILVMAVVCVPLMHQWTNGS